MSPSPCWRAGTHRPVHYAFHHVWAFRCGFPPLFNPPSPLPLFVLMQLPYAVPRKKTQINPHAANCRRSKALQIKTKRTSRRKGGQTVLLCLQKFCFGEPNCLESPQAIALQLAWMGAASGTAIMLLAWRQRDCVRERHCLMMPFFDSPGETADPPLEQVATRGLTMKEEVPSLQGLLLSAIRKTEGGMKKTAREEKRREDQHFICLFQNTSVRSATSRCQVQ